MACDHNSCMTSIAQHEGSKNRVYNGIIAHFGDISMTKVPSETKSHSLYASRVSSLSAESRHLFAILPEDGNPYGTSLKLSNLKWEAFQTRSLKKPYQVPSVSYEIKHHNFGNVLIQNTRDDEKSSYYSCKEYSIEIQLLHGTQPYSPEGTISDALETYNTIIYFV